KRLFLRTLEPLAGLPSHLHSTFRLLDRARDRAGAKPAPAASASRAEPVRESRSSRILQVHELPAGARLASDPTPRCHERPSVFQDHPPPRNLLLHVRDHQLRRRCLSTAHPCRTQPSPLHAVSYVLPASDRRPDCAARRFSPPA